jgi:hypothetical protein
MVFLKPKRVFFEFTVTTIEVLYYVCTYYVPCIPPYTMGLSPPLITTSIREVLHMVFESETCINFLYPDNDTVETIELHSTAVL